MIYRYRNLVICAFFAVLPVSQLHAADDDRSFIEEVIVTAHKREENLQSLPAAVSAFDSERLRVNSITALEDIARRTPGFVWAESSAADPNMFIRGIGTAGPSTFAGGDPSVVVMVDGVYIGRGAGTNTDLFDLERIEVLRGPQGSVYGKNAVGGVVNIVSKRPSHETDAQIEATFGNFDRINLRGYVTGSLGENLAGKLSVSSLNRDGFVENIETGNDLGDEESNSLRGSLLFTPNDKLEALVSFEYVSEDGSGAPRDIVETGTFNGGIHAITDPHPRKINATEDSYGERDIWALTVQFDYEMDIGDLTSITAYRDTEASWGIPFFGNPVTPTTIESTNINDDDYTQFSQEFRLASRPGDSPFGWTVGAYYFTSDADRFYRLNQEFASFLPFLGGIAIYDQTVKTENWAVFFNTNYQITDTLQLIVGARYSTEEKKQVHSGTVVLGPFPPPLLPGNQFADLRTTDDWDAFTPSFSLDWQVSNEAMLYASITKGFKSGGYQGIPPDPLSAATPFNPEFAWNYEIGAKTQWLEDRLQVNVAAFQIDHTDLQIAELIAGNRVVIGNAAEAEVKGVEVEFIALLLPNLQLSGSYAYLDAEFSSFADGATSDNTGNTLPFAPEHKVNLAVQYDIALSNGGSLSARVDWTRQSKIFLEASNTTEVQEAYSLVDARIAYTAVGDQWEIAAWGKNLGDELYRLNSVAFPPFGQELVLWSAPVTYGVSVTWRM